MGLKLRDFPTLAHVIQFAHDRQPELAAFPERRGPAMETLAAPVRPAPASLDAANAIPRRVPVPVPRPALTHCKATGVTLAAGRRVVLMPDLGGVAEALAQQLEAMGVAVLRLDRTLDAGALASEIEKWLAAGPIEGVYWLPALDNEGDLRGMDLDAWREGLQVRLKSLYTAMRALYGKAFLVSATRLGGHHGYDDAGAVAPLGGAVTGFTKTYKREQPDALVKAVDFGTGHGATEVAAALIAETLRDPGAVEIGYRDGQRWTVGLQEQPAEDGRPGLALDANTVFPDYPGQRAASFRPSPQIWRQPQAEPSTCWTVCPSRIRKTPT